VFQWSAVLIAVASTMLLAACGSAAAKKSDAAPSPGSSASTTSVTKSSDQSNPDPYVYLPKVPSFTVTSATVKSGEPLPPAQLSKMFKAPGGKDTSPQLSWSGFPAQTKSFVVSMFDPQAPTEFGGFTHWVVADIPGTTTALPEGAGAMNSKILPSGAFQLGADAGVSQYVGGAPPAGSGVHNYYLTITALDTAKTGLGSSASAAYLGFSIASHTIARATLISPTSIPAS
jgi:Raf kinase inhibitor-like YbhB/YbcL family protein